VNGVREKSVRITGVLDDNRFVAPCTNVVGVIVGVLGRLVARELERFTVFTRGAMVVASGTNVDVNTDFVRFVAVGTMVFLIVVVTGLFAIVLCTEFATDTEGGVYDEDTRGDADNEDTFWYIGAYTVLNADTVGDDTVDAALDKLEDMVFVAGTTELDTVDDTVCNPDCTACTPDCTPDCTVLLAALNTPVAADVNVFHRSAMVSVEEIHHVFLILGSYVDPLHQFPFLDHRFCFREPF
jgi:hypothetical protein